ncbi:MAG: preprotein translocase subunit SecA [Pseudomonadales bacterium]|nr:preprotein translocase subunit SecA [Pseudomonadales bacterium]MCP5185344.1 preprotein translocase subunit SecA [Pseudomonadales bacterium]
MFKFLFGTKNSRELKRMGRLVKRVNELEATYEAAADLPSVTASLKARFANGESLDDLLPDAFAVVREASKRATGKRHFDVQLLGGIALHEGRIAEMRTGEGKTLMATLPAYLNALSGKGVHIVTVNDYLAKRDAEWMGVVYAALGLTTGVVLSRQNPVDKREAYRADITYGTNNEFGFDYLRDNMAFTQEDQFQRGLNFAIVDEVDSILIDEARTPLIISGPAEESTELYRKINQLVPKLERQEFVERLGPLDRLDAAVEDEGDYMVDEKDRRVELTERGHQRVEDELVRMGLLAEGESLYATSHLNLVHHVLSALKAHAIFQRDVDYMVANGEIVIVDEHTGRAMPGRRWSEGLHQAVEAKEGVRIQNESQTLASTTFQNYFRLYGKLSGMTGTADTEAFEFRQIYGLDVVVIPTHMPMVRKDHNDLVFLTMQEKYDAIVADVVECRERNQPVLIGTASIESSELVSRELDRHKIPHNVLNAKQHQREAEIIAQAGKPGNVTIATNMAGRGTDIVLGGNWEAEAAALDLDEAGRAALKAQWQALHDQVLASGGLHIIGTERHESRRIDNQLRGRSGRQGDPGSSRFYLSMEDNLMRIFASDRMRGIMQSLGLKNGEAIEARMVNNAIEKAQRKVEGRNFDIRKNLLEYDDVANDQRQVIYKQRRDLMQADDISGTIEGMREEVLRETMGEYIPPQSLEEQWDLPGLTRALKLDFDSDQPVAEWLEADDSLNEESLYAKILDTLTAQYQAKEANWATLGVDIRVVEKQLMLQVLDQRWKEHLAAMDHLRSSIGLRAYAQKQPKQEYKRESFELFQELLLNIRRDVVHLLSRVQIEQPSHVEEEERRRRAEAEKRMQFQHASASALAEEGGDGQAMPEQPSAPQVETFVRNEAKVGRNEPCPCGSGKKFKHCHGKVA